MNVRDKVSESFHQGQASHTCIPSQASHHVQVIYGPLDCCPNIEVYDGRPALILNQLSTEVVVVNDARILGLDL